MGVILACIWIKCFGEFDGFPDVNPYGYNKDLVLFGSLSNQIY